MGEKSYKLALPPHLHVHDVFHVSLLKKYVPNSKHILDLDDNILVNQEEFQMELEQILKIKEKQLRNNGRVTQLKMLLGRTGINYLLNCLIYTLTNLDRKSTRLNSSHSGESRMPSSA